MRIHSRLIVALGASALALAGCSLTDDVPPVQDPEQSPPAATPTETEPTDATPDIDEPGPLVAMTTTTPLGSVVEQIAQCGGGTAETIMGIGDDPHSFQPSSAQVAAMVGAPVVFFSGLRLEESLLSVIDGAGADGAHALEIGTLVDPLTFEETGGSAEHSHDDDHDHDGDGHQDHAHDDHDDDHDHDGDGHQDHAAEDHHDDGYGHDEDGFDPHWWLDVARMAKAAQIIGDELAEETGNPDYAQCGADLSQELLDLDSEIAEELSPITSVEGRNALVTDHLAFGYFAQRYGFEMVGAVIPSVNTDAEPSSADLANLVHTIEEHQVPAIFANVASPSALAGAVAAEVGHDVAVVPLFTESLGPVGSGAETYQEMMRTNAQLIADALSN